MSTPSYLEFYDLETTRGAVIAAAVTAGACATGLALASVLAYLLLSASPDARQAAVDRLKWAIDLYGACAACAALWLVMGVIA